MSLYRCPSNVSYPFLCVFFFSLLSRAICRIVETADILNHLSKSTNKSSPPHRTALTPVKGQASSNNKDKRFKTSGLVATAVQSSHTRNKSHHHSSNGRKTQHHRITNNNNIAQRQLSSLVYTDSSIEETTSRNSLKVALRKTKSNSTNNYMKNKLGNEQNNKRT